MASSITETLDQINTALKNSSGPYSSYSCKTVSWDDVQRGTVGDSLSCWGANITDTRLYAKDGRQLFTVRGDNWNERLGKVSVDDIALIASNINGGGACDGLQPVTLRTLLSNISEYGNYAGINVDSLLSDDLDREVSVRFQTTFLPVEEGEKQTLEFAPQAYNYNTTSDEDPRNLVLLCTTQGLAIQQDGAGAKMLYHHTKNEDDDSVNRYWLEAESSSHKVGGSQVETKEERDDALKRGKAISTVIGTKDIGTRFNVLMTIQVPLKQKEKEKERKKLCMSGYGGPPGAGYIGAPYCASGFYMMDMECCAMEEEECDESEHDEECYDLFRYRDSTTSTSRIEGKSSAARVSRGSLVDKWNGLSVNNPQRHPHEHITATIVLYYTCSGGVPSSNDVRAAIDDIEKLYAAVEVNGRLNDDAFNFMKSELKVKDLNDISKKLTMQPPKAPMPCAPANFDIFPN